jgi:hypothetical protein
VAQIKSKQKTSTTAEQVKSLLGKQVPKHDNVTILGPPYCKPPITNLLLQILLSSPNHHKVEAREERTGKKKKKGRER